ncbi:unnamed protein product [Phytophthora lilii]|uniref:Unnamed protein product n=1 Tax=Phytophthora lilii TaxID=2077276 RepID=A0A9W6XIS3_9STRA|nr:unnamed protein product [Phytophthora lilii]
MGETELYPDREEDISHYVHVLEPGNCKAGRSAKRGLVEVVSVELSNGFGVRPGDPREREPPEVVRGRRRVVCAVRNFEALSGGFIDCLPPRMLADTGASLNDAQSYPRSTAVRPTVEQETYWTAMTVLVRLPPRGRSLMLTNVRGDVADRAIVMVEDLPGLPPTLGVARTLCTVQEGQVIVKVCNASADEYWIGKGTVATATSLIPESAFAPTVQSGVGYVLPWNASKRLKALPPDKGMKADCSESGLFTEQKDLFQDELNGFSDLSSKKPGRTELLKFQIDTDDSKPIKQQPYRVSGAEEKVMEARLISTWRWG